MSELHAASIGRVTEPVLVVEGGITEREEIPVPHHSPPFLLFFFSSSFVFISGRLFFSVPSSSPLLFHTQLTGKRKKNPKEKQLCVREKTVRSKYFGRRFFFSSPSSFPSSSSSSSLVRSLFFGFFLAVHEREREKRPASPLVRLVSGRPVVSLSPNVCVQASSSCVPSACAPLCRVQCTVSGGGGLFTSEIISTHKKKTAR